MRLANTATTNIKQKESNYSITLFLYIRQDFTYSAFKVKRLNPTTLRSLSTDAIY